VFLHREEPSDHRWYGEAIDRSVGHADTLSAMTFHARAILFDLDGVLVDSMPAVRAAWTDWAGRRGLSAETVLASLHLTAEELVRTFAPGLDPATEAQAIALRQASLDVRIAALQGARELVAGLPRERWAVITSGRRALALRHLELGGLPIPEVLITAEDTPRGKPDPAGYLLAAERLRIPPAECLVIEDSPAGVRAARSAGMAVVAVTTSHRAAELAEADAVISSLGSVRVRVETDGALSVVAE
jgi:sugar-phosphatase